MDDPGATPFVLECPDTVEEALAVLASHEDTLVMAGGQSLTVLIKLGLADPDAVVSLRRCDELRGTDETANGRVRIGAMTTAATAQQDDLLLRRAPLLTEAAGHIGSPHVRNFGTVVGNVCHADPGGDPTVALLCMDARVELRSQDGDRAVDLEDYVLGPYMTVREPQEMAVAVDLTPIDQRWATAYTKMALRAGDLAVGAAAAALRIADNRVVEARVAVGGGLPHPRRLHGLERQLVGRRGGDLPAELLDFAITDTDDMEFLEDGSYPGWYRGYVLSKLVGESIRKATE